MKNITHNRLISVINNCTYDVAELWSSFLRGWSIKHGDDKDS